MNLKRSYCVLVSVAALNAGLAGCGADKREDDGADTGSRQIPGVALVENGEDNDARIQQDEAGWDGYWYTYDDKNECTNMTPELGMTNPSTAAGGFMMSEYAMAGVAAPALEGEQEENLYGVRIWGGGHTATTAGGFGAGLGFALNGTSGIAAFDLAAAGFVGIRFQIKSGIAAPATQPVSVKIKDTWSEPAGMVCIPRDELTCGPQGCHDDPIKSVTATSEWTLQTIMFSEFMRGGWSQSNGSMTPAPPSTMLDATAAYQVQFEIPSTAMFDIWIDNLGFVLGDGTVVPMPTGSAASIATP